MTEQTQDQNEAKDFVFFLLTGKSCDSCLKAMDTGGPMVHSDSQAERACCLECQWVCWPFTIVIDLISCPFRGTYHAYGLCKKKIEQHQVQNPEHKVQKPEHKVQNPENTKTNKQVYNNEYDSAKSIINLQPSTSTITNQ